MMDGDSDDKQQIKSSKAPQDQSAGGSGDLSKGGND